MKINLQEFWQKISKVAKVAGNGVIKMKIPPLVSLGSGIAFYSFVYFWIDKFILYFFNISLPDNILLKIGKAIPLGLLFYLQMDKIENVHIGVLTFLGARTKLALTEGNHWLFKPVIFFRDVTLKKEIKEIPQITVLSAGGNGIEVTTDISVAIKIANPFLFLENEEEIKDKGIIKVVDAAVRAALGALTPEEAKNGRKDGVLAKEIGKEIEEKISKWGFKLIETPLIGDIGFSTEITKAMERDKKEEMDTRADQREWDNIRSLAKALVEDSNETLTFKEAYDLVQVYRGETKKQIFDIQGMKDAGLLGPLAAGLLSKTTTPADDTSDNQAQPPSTQNQKKKKKRK